jgi:hypothetical protein
MKKLITLMFLAVAGISTTVSAQKPAVVVNDKTGWHKIAETTVDFTKDHDEVAVLIADKFSTLKFKVTDASIQLIDMEIFYESGDSQKVPVGYEIKSMGESKVIDLNGGERSIKKISFHYKTVPNTKDQKAHVEIWGKKTNSDK